MENFNKYHKIKALGHRENQDIFLNPEDQIVIQEKIDGANFRFMIVDGKPIFGSRTQELTGDEDGKYTKNFRRCIDYVREQLSILDFEELGIDFNGFIFYGECCVKHTIAYDFENMPPFLGFDVYDLKEDRYLEFESVDGMFDLLQLPVVPLIKICKAEVIGKITDETVPKSIYTTGQAEGIVFKNYNKQLFGKYVREKFKEENRDTFGGTVKYTEDETGKVVAKWCTNGRIEKAIFQFIDSGDELDMPLMSKVPKYVYHDIWSEHWSEIIEGKSIKEVNFRKMHKQITKRCFRVLQQMITNNALTTKEE